MKNIITVYDNFFEDPNNVRNKALEQDFYSWDKLSNVATEGEENDNKIREVFPGQQSLSCEKILLDIYKEFNKKISSFMPNDNVTVNAFFQRQTKDDFRYIYQDGKPSLSGLIYLDDNPAFNTGTCFFRHKETGRDGTEEANISGTTDIIQADKELDPSKGKMQGQDNFEKHSVIGNKFNRMIMYDSNMFLRAEGAEDERLTLSFFVYLGK
ncbi:MAG: hypothetical protein CXT73_00325 [Methanobacteriota archaeon]|jgi:hypothetical protein|nr:MAG: hypothetical protein CXT73_00325 [Euryarchaeota archaeon]